MSKFHKQSKLKRKDMDSRLLKSIPNIIEKTFPIPARFRSRLPADIAELSRLLTSSRGDRSLSYLNRPNFLSAYLHYFLPWNIYRLCLLLPSLDINLAANDTVVDLGSGTLTFVCALWIAREDLRNIPLEFFCVDRSGQALEAGKKFFTALAGDSPWKIKLIRENINFFSQRPQRTQRKAKLITAVNIFNELYEKIPHTNTERLKKTASDAAYFLHNQAGENAYIFTMEPGVPQSGRFISFLRDALLEMGHCPAAPCAHGAACPLTGTGSTEARAKKWCHFAREDFDPPKELARLSAAAKLPKERLVYSYLLTNVQCTRYNKFPIVHDPKGRTIHNVQKNNEIRVISDAFPLPNGKNGRYGCFKLGLALLAGEKDQIEKVKSGSLVKNYTNTNRLDEKSGAVIINLP